MDKSNAPQVIGIASGKGGVGKTTITVNLAVALAKRGLKVLLLDADLGLANAQLALGCQAPYNLGHVLRGEKTLSEIIVRTDQGVGLVPGASGVRELAALDERQVAAIVNAFDELTEPVDYLLVDVAAGLSPSVLQIMAACQRRFVVLCDQPASIADAYGLIKVMATEETLDQIYVLPNLAQSQGHGQQLFSRLNEVSQRFLQTTLRYIGTIEADELIVDAQKKYQSVLEWAPGSSGSRDFRRLAQAVVDLPPLEKASGRIQFFMNRMLHTNTQS